MRRLVHRMRGLTELRVSEPTLRLLAARQTALVQALLRRGHAAVDELDLGRDHPADGAEKAELADVLPRALPKPLRTAMSRPVWSRLDQGRGHHTDDGRRWEAVEELADAIEAAKS